MKKISIVFPIVMLTGLTLYGQGMNYAPSGQQMPVAKVPGHETDSTVLIKLHEANIDEMAMGRLAQEKGQSSAVRQFGKQLYDDHQAADKKVMDLAQKKNISLARERQMVGQEQEKQTIQKLKTLNGAEFDREFARVMKEDHAKDISFLQQASSTTRDSDIKDLIQDTLPTLHQHETTALQLEK